jgi:heme/copper-type cytochrome/quinol oxidase subunit 4
MNEDDLKRLNNNSAWTTTLVVIAVVQGYLLWLSIERGQGMQQEMNDLKAKVTILEAIQ